MTFFCGLSQSFSNCGQKPIRTVLSNICYKIVNDFNGNCQNKIELKQTLMTVNSSIYLCSYHCSYRMRQNNHFPAPITHNNINWFLYFVFFFYCFCLPLFVFATISMIQYICDAKIRFACYKFTGFSTQASSTFTHFGYSCFDPVSIFCFILFSW